LHDASLYVLDEPTVHLDPDAEREAIDALRVRLADRSAVVVTHRPAPLALADRVFELRDGRIVELGGSRTESATSPVSV